MNSSRRRFVAMRAACSGLRLFRRAGSTDPLMILVGAFRSSALAALGERRMVCAPPSHATRPLILSSCQSVLIISVIQIAIVLFQSFSRNSLSAFFCNFRIRVMVLAGIRFRFFKYPSSTIIRCLGAYTKNRRTPVVGPRASKRLSPKAAVVGRRSWLPYACSISSNASASAAASSDSPSMNSSSVVLLAVFSEWIVQRTPDYTCEGIPRATP